jgi:WD40 repeat protein
MIWDSATGRALVAPLQHRDYVWHVCFSPDDRMLLTLSRDRTARVWDVATGEPITPPLLHDGQVLFGAWRPDGREVATCSEDGTARVWDVSPSAATIAELQRQAELLSAHRLEVNIGSVPLTAAQMRARWRRDEGGESVEALKR